MLTSGGLPDAEYFFSSFVTVTFRRGIINTEEISSVSEGENQGVIKGAIEGATKGVKDKITDLFSVIVRN
jgi:hypothetical protein